MIDVQKQNTQFEKEAQALLLLSEVIFDGFVTSSLLAFNNKTNMCSTF
jgi:hypothetical protein